METVEIVIVFFQDKLRCINKNGATTKRYRGSDWRVPVMVGTSVAIKKYSDSVNQPRRKRKYVAKEPKTRATNSRTAMQYWIMVGSTRRNILI